MSIPRDDNNTVNSDSNHKQFPHEMPQKNATYSHSSSFPVVFLNSVLVDTVSLVVTNLRVGLTILL